MKENYAKPKISGRYSCENRSIILFFLNQLKLFFFVVRKLFCPSNNSLKEENATDVASTVVTETKSATVRIQADVSIISTLLCIFGDYQLSYFILDLLTLLYRKYNH
jgi:hypothetical protein